VTKQTTPLSIGRISSDPAPRSGRAADARARRTPIIRAQELFDGHRLTAFHDPFADGALPLEALRLRLEAYVSDPNPVAMPICSASSGR
jgi:adenine-specific DNA methylase